MTDLQQLFWVSVVVYSILGSIYYMSAFCINFIDLIHYALEYFEEKDSEGKDSEGKDSEGKD
jgi:uncharacterized membrane protein YesL